MLEEIGFGQGLAQVGTGGLQALGRLGGILEDAGGGLGGRWGARVRGEVAKSGGMEIERVHPP